jgi:site-specific DNA-cytosine methylase
MAQDIKWGSIVPLIGGMTIANKNATGNDPSFLLSYDAFKSNDSHCVNYFKDTPYQIIDSTTNELENFDEDLFSNVDFVSTVCPCAGLSMLNSSRKEGGRARGSDAVQNEWMYKTAGFVLEKIQPKVFWGENAPGLYTSLGEGVVKNLISIGEKFGYSFSLVKTNTFLHGIPQHRVRSFYFFWKDSDAPVLNYVEKEPVSLEEYLSQVPSDASLMDRFFGLGKLENNGWVKFLESKNFTMKDAIESEHHSLLQIVLSNKWTEDAIEWADKNNEPSLSKTLNHVKDKRSQDKGWWDGTPLVFKDATNAIIAKNIAIIHPNGKRGISLREAMWLMGLPHDFEMVENGHWNHICQNVPVSTARDWTNEVISFVRGEKKDFGGKFLKQSNISKRIDFSGVKSKILF